MTSVAALAVAFAAVSAPLAARTAAPTTGTRAFCEAFEQPADPRLHGCTGNDADDPAAAAAVAAATRAQHQCLELLNAAVEAKHLRMDQAGARRCAQARQAFLADPRQDAGKRSAADKACEATFIGLQKQGQACESPWECVQGLVCAGTDGGAPGTCRPPLARGVACSADVVNASAVAAAFAALRGVCGPGSHCAGTSCAADVRVGAACDAVHDPDICGNGFTCIRGVCAPKRLGGDGDACVASVDCAAGFRCELKTYACVAAAPNGATCAKDDDCAGACRKNRCAPRCGAP